MTNIKINKEIINRNITNLTNFKDKNTWILTKFVTNVIRQVIVK